MRDEESNEQLVNVNTTADKGVHYTTSLSAKVFPRVRPFPRTSGRARLSKFDYTTSRANMRALIFRSESNGREYWENLKRVSGILENHRHHHHSLLSLESILFF